uniref:GB1/RHD3-type G domain-containing protein n=1 Tax=Tetradesmus obliquus TaxID=3088 RepID=A0A383VGT1_TETOB|eukprot:jgi/Sobl393_1/5485/SZX64411.1
MEYPAGAPAPLQLISIDSATGRVSCGEEALACLRSIKTPIGVVSVCGRARTGKSYILNQLLGQSTGFQLAHSHRPCTKGLWIWSKPFRRVGPDGNEYHLVLLDSEGIDAYDQRAQDGVQLLSLAVLLSSMFVFNQMGPIDEAALDRLSLVTQITKHIRVRAGGAAAEDASELSTFTPSFLWLLRDFYLDLEDEGRKVSPREYLETALSPSAGAGAAVEAKNQIRGSIKALFPDRDCFTLVRPMHDERALNRLNTLQQEQLRPEFQEGVSKLTRLLLARAQPKRIGFVPVSGVMLAGLAEAYSAAINEGAVPTIATAWQGVAEAECRRAAAAAEDAYRLEFNVEGTPAEPEALLEEHLRCMAAAKAVFKSIAVAEPRVRGEAKAGLIAALQHRYELTREAVLARAAAGVDQALLSAAQQISTAARLHKTWAEVQGQVSTAIAAYDAATAGPTKWPRLTVFLQQQYGHMVADFVQKCEADAEKKISEARTAAREAEWKLSAAENKANKAEIRVRDLVSAEEALKLQLSAERQRHSSSSRSSSGGGWLACFRPSEGGGF